MPNIEAKNTLEAALNTDPGCAHAAAAVGAPTPRITPVAVEAPAVKPTEVKISVGKDEAALVGIMDKQGNLLHALTGACYDGLRMHVYHEDGNVQTLDTDGGVKRITITLDAPRISSVMNGGPMQADEFKAFVADTAGVAGDDAFWVYIAAGYNRQVQVRSVNIFPICPTTGKVGNHWPFTPLTNIKPTALVVGADKRLEGHHLSFQVALRFITRDTYPLEYPEGYSNKDIRKDAEDAVKSLAYVVRYRMRNEGKNPPTASPDGPRRRRHSNVVTDDGVAVSRINSALGGMSKDEINAFCASLTEAQKATFYGITTG